MFDRLEHIPRDPLWALTEAFRLDAHENKMDLILGVYKNEAGQTPVLDAVQQAERQLALAAKSKTYRPLTGNVTFTEEIPRLVLGERNQYLQNTVSVQTVGGAGALRSLGDLVAWSNPNATVWVSRPGYINHEPIMLAAGLKVKYYPWEIREGELSVEAIQHAMRDAKAGDVLLIQGCCHNPTGIDPSHEAWDQISIFCEARGLVPLIDIAYQGLGNGMQEDAAGLRHMVDTLETVMIAVSCSKNMSLYCERTGAALVVQKNRNLKYNVTAALEQIARRSISMPPEHGAAVAVSLLLYPQPWLNELEQMRYRISRLRGALFDAFLNNRMPDEFLAVKRHVGMFSLLPIDQSQVIELRNEYGIYCTNEGR
ncbi:aminotransferase class I/II-fold pyridoxal phosphate-dependent enzyme, partial [Escherichia coli]|nr:aminotransferase class I/II-fold pyridoxal phosphate-dependent enzyme [Escherichia coli]